MEVDKMDYVDKCELMKVRTKVPENRMYPELPQDMGKLWSHWVGSVRGEIRGLYGRCLEKMIYWPKMQLFGAKSFFCDVIQIFATIMTGHQKGKVFVLNPLHRGIGAVDFGPKIRLSYRTPIFVIFHTIKSYL